MDTKVYYYFHSIYGNATEPVICVDENLNIVYATIPAYDIFGLKKSPILHLNCVFMRKYLKPIKTAFEKGECFSLKFESINDNSSKKCIIMPHFYDGDKYAILLFTDISSEEIDNLTKSELKRGISIIENTIVASTSLIVSHMRNIKEKFPDNDSINLILKNILIIRRMFRNLGMLATSDLKSKSPQIIEINEYLKYITQIISSQIGNEKVEFNLLLTKDTMLAEIEPKIFEILICNLVSNSVRNTFGKSKITFQTAQHDQNNLIVISDNGIGGRQFEQMFSATDKNRNRRFNEFTDIGVSIIKKIITDHNGQILASEGRGGGMSLGIMLPKADSRHITEFRSPGELEISEDIFTTINIEISDLLDINNLSL